MKSQIYLLPLLAGISLCLPQQIRAQCSVNAGPDPVVYVGYAPMSCATLAANATGSAPIAYTWSNGSTGASVTSCDQVTTIYWVTITDGAGCTATDSVTV